MNDTILFYLKNKSKNYDSDYFAFSNYYPNSKVEKLQIKISIDNKIFPTSEHYFQYKKFSYEGASRKSEDYAELIRTASTPNISRILGGQLTSKLPPYKWAQDLKSIIQEYSDVSVREDWDNVRNNIMRKAVYSKFYQNKNLQELLLSTFPKKIIEASPRDSYWGYGKNKKGNNMLGKILEEVRYILLVNFRNKNPQSNKKIKVRGKKPYVSPLEPKEIYPSIHSYGQWVIKDYLFASAYPGLKTEKATINLLDKIFDKNQIQHVLDLMEESQRASRDDIDYTKYMKRYKVDYCNFPIVDKSVGNDKEIYCMTFALSSIISGGDSILIHCLGGKGRTGTIIAIIMGIIYGMNEKEALKYTGRNLHLRENLGRVKPEAPQTQSQFKQISRIFDKYL